MGIRISATTEARPGSLRRLPEITRCKERRMLGAAGKLSSAEPRGLHLELPFL